MFEAARPGVGGGALGKGWAGVEAGKGWARDRDRQGWGIAGRDAPSTPAPRSLRPPVCTQRQDSWESPQALTHLNIPAPLPLTGWFPWGSEPGLPLQAPPKARRREEASCLPPTKKFSNFLSGWEGTHSQWLVKTLRVITFHRCYCTPSPLQGIMTLNLPRRRASDATDGLWA